MALLPGLRHVFTRRKPLVEIEVATVDQADGIGERRAVTASSAGTAGSPGSDLERDPQQAGEEVLGLVRRIGNHLETQAEHTRRLDDLIDRLPSAVDALPELNRQNARVLDVLGDHLDRNRSREDALHATLGRLGEVSNHQTEILGIVQRQLDVSHRSAGHVIETLGSVREALGGLAESTGRSIELIGGMMLRSDERATELGALMGRMQRWMIITIICSGAVAAGSLIVAIAVLLR